MKEKGMGGGAPWEKVGAVLEREDEDIDGETIEILLNLYISATNSFDAYTDGNTGFFLLQELRKHRNNPLLNGLLDKLGAPYSYIHSAIMDDMDD